MEIFICLTFAILLVFIITVIAFKYGKPTTNNYGTIHNHYYGRDEQDDARKLPDGNVLLIAQHAVEALKIIHQNKDENPMTKQDSSE